MAWTDNLLPAQLDGVEFLYSEVSNEGGRRVETHVFPGRDDSFTEDMGRSPRRYMVAAFFIGENYASPLAQLIEKLESGNKMLFVHPYKGTKFVKVDGNYKQTESDQEGRFARIDFTLIEDGYSNKKFNIDTAARVKVIAATTMESLSKKTKFSLLGAIGAVFNSVARGINKASTQVRKVNGKVAGFLNTVDNITDSINEFEKELGVSINTPTAMMNAFTALFSSLFNLIKEYVPDPRDIDVEDFVPDLVLATLQSLDDLFSFESAEFVIPTPTEQYDIEFAAHAAITGTTKAAAVIAAADTLVELDLDSANQAELVQQNLVDKVEILLNEDFDNDVIENLLALKAAVVEHFSTTSINLPRTRTITLLATTPAITMAYELYEDATRDADIIRRNKIRHPGFMPGGTDIEVLTNDE